MFANRQEAGRLLSEKIALELPHYMSAESPQYVIGISSGGILVAGPVCIKMKSPLSIFEAETILDIERPTKEIAVVSPCGSVIYNDKFRYGQGEQAYVGHQVKELAKKARKSQKAWLNQVGLEVHPQLNGKRIVIIDEGMASDTMRKAAAVCARNRGATEVVLAAPAICKTSRRKLQGTYDHIVSLESPVIATYSLRNLYQDCRKVDDADVMQTLIQSAIFLHPERVVEAR